jgi:hypothetical protein
LFHVHPSGGFFQRRFAPEAEDEADERTKNGRDARPADNVGGHRREFENRKGNEKEQRSDEQPNEQPAQPALDATPLRCACERRLDDLEFAHCLAQVEPMIGNRRVNLVMSARRKIILNGSLDSGDAKMFCGELCKMENTKQI